MAAGKSTTAEALALKLDKCVHLRGDVFRRMISSGREEMSTAPSEEAVRQLYALSMSAEAKKVGIAYDKADAGTKGAVKKLLDVE